DDASPPRRERDGSAEQADADNCKSGDTHAIKDTTSDRSVPARLCAAVAFGHLTVDPRSNRLVAQTVIAVRIDFDSRIAAEFRQGFLQTHHGPFEIEGIRAAGPHMQLTGKFGGKRFPIALKYKADVITIP